MLVGQIYEKYVCMNELDVKFTLVNDIFLDNDKNSLTYKSFCVRHGAVSYDGFDTFVEAFIFMRGL